MKREYGVGPKGTASSDAENEWVKGQHSITLQETTKESRCLEDEPFDSLKRRSTVDMEESHRRGRLRTGGERNAEEPVSTNIHKGNGEIQ